MLKCKISKNFKLQYSFIFRDKIGYVKKINMLIFDSYLPILSLYNLDKINGLTSELKRNNYKLIYSFYEEKALWLSDTTLSEKNKILSILMNLLERIKDTKYLRCKYEKLMPVIVIHIDSNNFNNLNMNLHNTKFLRIVKEKYERISAAENLADLVCNG